MSELSEVFERSLKINESSSATIKRQTLEAELVANPSSAEMIEVLKEIQESLIKELPKNGNNSRYENVFSLDKFLQNNNFKIPNSSTRQKIEVILEAFDSEISGLKDVERKAIEKLIAIQTSRIILPPSEEVLNAKISSIRNEITSLRNHLTVQLEQGLSLILQSKKGGRELLSKWYEEHVQNPYPTQAEKLELVEKSGLTYEQVNIWFCNKRSRSDRKTKQTKVPQSQQEYQSSIRS